MRADGAHGSRMGGCAERMGRDSEGTPRATASELGRLARNLADKSGPRHRKAPLAACRVADFVSPKACSKRFRGFAGRASEWWASCRTPGPLCSHCLCLLGAERAMAGLCRDILDLAAGVARIRISSHLRALSKTVVGVRGLIEVYKSVRSITLIASKQART